MSRAVDAAPLYITCPTSGDRVPVAEDVSKSLEPGACQDSMLVTESELDEYQTVLQRWHTSSDAAAKDELCWEAFSRTAQDEPSSSSCGGHQLLEEPAAEVENPVDDGADDGDLVDSADWKAQHKHVFVLSESGKPIYSRHGSEERLVTLFGVMQALVSFVGDSDGDALRCLTSGAHTIVFLHRPPLMLVAASRGAESVAQLVLQLSHVYSQILSVVTLSQLQRIGEHRRNFDFRKLVSGAERYLDELLTAVDGSATYLLEAVQCLRLESAARDAIVAAVQASCGRIRDLVFALLVCGDRLVCLVRMKKVYLHPTDYHIICNVVTSTESFKSVEGWTPICLPKLDASGFLYAHVSYLSDSCPACLVLLTSDRELFHPLSEARASIVQRLQAGQLIDQLSAAAARHEYHVQETGVVNMRHFMYKCVSTAQLTRPAADGVYGTPHGRQQLHALYHTVHGRLHAPGRPLRTYCTAGSEQLLLGWLSAGIELYAVFEPYVTLPTAVAEMNRLLRWIKEHERTIFILGAPTF